MQRSQTLRSDGEAKAAHIINKNTEGARGCWTGMGEKNKHASPPVGLEILYFFSQLKHLDGVSFFFFFCAPCAAEPTIGIHVASFLAAAAAAASRLLQPLSIDRGGGGGAAGGGGGGKQFFKCLICMYVRRYRPVSYYMKKKQLIGCLWGHKVVETYHVPQWVGVFIALR